MEVLRTIMLVSRTVIYADLAILLTLFVIAVVFLGVSVFLLKDE